MEFPVSAGNDKTGNNDYIYRAHAWFVCSHEVLFTVRKSHTIRWHTYNQLLLQH